MNRYKNIVPAIWISTTVLILITFVLTLGCTKKGKEIKIGSVLPLTGGAGKYGEDAKLGIELALEERNLEGGINGKPIKVIFEDDQTIPQQTVTAFNKLIKVDKVAVVIGAMTSSSALAIAPIAEQLKVVLLSPSASTPNLTNAGDFIFRNELSDAYGGTAQAILTWKQLGIKSTAILYINNDYGIGVKNAFIKTYNELGGQVIGSESFEADAQDFRTQLIRIRQKNPEALFMVAYKESILILRQIKELNLKFKILSTPVFEDQEILEKSGKSAEGVVYVYYGGFDAQSNNEVVSRFVNSFRKKYNRESGYYSALAYDAMNIIIFAIQKSGARSEEIKNALYTIKDFPGVTGITNFDENGDVTKPVILKTVDNGKFVEWDREK